MENFQPPPSPPTLTDHHRRSNHPKRSGSGVKLSTDPQSVAARQRRHRISDRFRTLKSLVPGGSKMDTVSMLEEAINYVKFLKTQIWLHQAHHHAIIMPSSTSTSDNEFQPTFPSTTACSASDQEMMCYSLPQPAVLPVPSLPPLPYCSFQGGELEEIMPPLNTFNY